MSNFDWSSPPLAPEDQELIDAYEAVGRSLDFLPYTPEFEELFQRLRRPEEDAQRHQVWLRLLRLRKSGLLPRVGFRSAMGA